MEKLENSFKAYNFRAEIAKLFIGKGSYLINYTKAKKLKEIEPLLYANAVDFKEVHSDRGRESTIERIEIRAKEAKWIIDEKISGMIKSGKSSELYSNGVIKPKISWKTKETRKQAIRKLAFYFKKPVVNINAKDFQASGLGALLQSYYGHSPYRAFKDAGYNFFPWEREMAPLRTYKDKKTRVAAVRWLVKKIKKPITEITWEDFELNGLSGLRTHDSKKIYELLEEAGYKISPWETKSLPNGILDNKEKRVSAIREFVEKQKKAVIDISFDNFRNSSLCGMLKDYYNNSPYKALKEAGYGLLPWEMNAVPRKFWNKRDNRIKATSWLVKNIKKPATEITWEDFRNKGLGGLLKIHGNSPYAALKEAGYINNPKEMKNRLQRRK